MPALPAAILSLALGLLPLQPEPATEQLPVVAPAWVDPESGRSLLNYPPHRAADIRHLRLDLSIPDMNVPRLNGVATLTVEPIARPLTTLTLNAAAIAINAASCDGRDTTFSLNPADETLELRFDPPIDLGARADIRIDYTVEDPAEGIVWSVASPAYPGRAPQLHTQSQSESARYWFPCFDSASERLTSEMVITVPRGFTAVSNGKLVAHDVEPDRERFHWKQEREHVSYLITLAVGKFDIVDVAPPGSAVPMPVYVPPGSGDRVQATFGRTARMLELFERLFDEPFPWEKYAQVLVWNFAWGGMENTSATTLIDTTLLDDTALLDGDEDGLISHELAHQWFGDLITCRSWEHIWLNEGFATYSEKLWDQYRASRGPTLTPDNDAYFWGILQDMEAIIDNDRGDDPFQPSMQCKCYAHSIEVFQKAADPYAKGSAVLHMLRERLGDEAFFAAVAQYVDRHAGRSVETYEFRRAIEDSAGASLQRFFEQWCRRPGVPRLHIRHEWRSDEQKLAIQIEQTQRIDGDAPAYAFDLPVWVRTAAGEQWITIPVEARNTEFAAELDSGPQAVVFDPRLTVLAERRILHPEPQSAVLWLAQLRDGPTLSAKIEAVRGLAAAVVPRRPDAPPHGLIVTALDTLVETVDNPRLHPGLRRRAAEALGWLANPGLDVLLDAERAGEPMAFPDRNAGAILARLAQSPIDNARVRRTVIEQLARAGAPGGTVDDRTRARILSILSERFHRDASHGVRAAAVRGVGTMHAADGVELIRTALQTDSFADQIRQASLEAYAELDLPEALGAAAKLSTPGNQQFTREAAAAALAMLAHHDESSAIAALTDMLADASSPRARNAAAAALGEIASPAAVEALEDALAKCRSREFRHELTKALHAAE